MSSFKRKLSAFVAFLAIASMTSTQVMALDTDNIISKTDNITMPSASATNFVIDMKSSAGKGAFAQVDWKDYNIPENQTAKYGFSNDNQTILNRVLGGNTSYILGKMITGCSEGVSCGSAVSTGKVLVINPAGVLFGSGSSVDLNSLTVSTKDINGVKNLSEVSNLSEYQKTLNGLSKNMKFTGGSKEGTVWFDNATLKADKSIGVVADNIVYKNSILKTTAGNSNVKLVTADGVTFTYDDSGLITKSTAQAGKNNATIYMDNSGLNSKEAISSGNIELKNNSNSANSYIYLKNTVLKGTKLATDDNGDILIQSANSITTDNTKADAQGNLSVASGKTTNIYNSSNLSAGETASIEGKNTYISTSEVKAKDIKASASDKIYVYSNANLSATNDLNVNSTNQMLIADAKVSAGNDLTAGSTEGNAFISNSQLSAKSGNLAINSDKATAQIYNNSSLSAGTTAKVSAKDVYVTKAQISGKNAEVNATDKTYVYGNAKINATQEAKVASVNQLYVANSQIKGNEGVSATSTKGSAYIDNANLTSSSGNVTVSAAKENAYLYNNSVLSAGATAQVSGKDAIVTKAQVKGKNATVASTDKTYVYDNAKITADKNANVTSTNQLYVANSEVNGKEKVALASINDNAFISKANLTSASGSVTVSANKGSAQLYNGTKISAGTTASLSASNAYINNASVNGKNVTVDGKNYATVFNATLDATSALNVKSDNGQVYTNNVKLNSNNGNTNVSAGTNAFLYNTEITNKATTSLKASDGIYTANAKVNGTTISLRGQGEAKYTYKK